MQLSLENENTGQTIISPGAITLMKVRNVIVLLLLVLANSAFSQLKISGTVTDSLQKPIVAASITLHKGHGALIVAYAITNVKGGYSLQYANANATDTFYLKANAIGFTIKVAIVAPSIAQQDFVLKTSSVQLPSITVKNNKPFLKYKADTLSYAVDSFAHKQDRTIGDVLRKMPGIDVDANGKISYNGKAISNFYIDGDNLLDDKYNLATNSIGADMVKDVQVLENHQPIRALKDAAISDKVAINLNLKEKTRLKLSTRAELRVGQGGATTLYDATLNGMAFKKQYKAINSFKTNNVGNDISNDVVSHNIMDYLKSIQNNVPQNMLSINQPAMPAIGQRRYLFNNAALINTNNLFKTRKGLQLKTNLYFLHDKQSQNFSNTSTYYLPTDTIQYIQLQNTIARNSTLHAQLDATSNFDKAYFNNRLVVEYSSLPVQSATSFNGVLAQQQLKQQNTNISNEFNLIKTRHTNHVLEYYSYLNYLTKPESLQLAPGLNENYFNNGLPYQQLLQQVNVPTFFTHNYFNYRLPKGKILQSYKMGFTGLWQQLDTKTMLVQANGSSSMADSLANQLLWHQQKAYANANFDYMGERLKLSLALPLSWQHVYYSNAVTAKQTKLIDFNGIFFNPSINLRYATGIENFVSLNYTYGNGIGNVQDAYSAAVVRNYNLVMANSIDMKQSNAHAASIAFNYRRTIKIFFWNMGATWSSSNNNSIAQTQLMAGIQKQTFVPLNNAAEKVSLFSGASKYLFALHTTVNLKLNYTASNWLQLQNGRLLGFASNAYSVSTGISPKVSKWLNLSYSGSYALNSSKAKLLNATRQQVTMMQHGFEANGFFTNDLYLKLKADDYYVKRQSANNYLFADIALQYKANKIKADFLLELSNLANTTEYRTVNLSANNQVENLFYIRPRMLTLKAFFNF